MINIGILFEKYESYYSDLFEVLSQYGLSPFFVTSSNNNGILQEIQKPKVFYSAISPELVKNLLDNKLSIILNCTKKALPQDLFNDKNFLVITKQDISKDNPTLIVSVTTKSNLKSDILTFLGKNKEELYINVPVVGSIRDKPQQETDSDTLIYYIYENNSYSYGQLVSLSSETNRKVTFIYNGVLGDSNQILTYYYSVPDSLKKSYKVYPSCNWQHSKDLYNAWIKFQPENLKGIVDFTLNKEEADYYMVINSSNEQLEPNKILYFAMEPCMDKSPQFSQYINLLKSNAQHVPFIGEHQLSINNVEWHLSTPLEEFKTKNIAKQYDKVLSVVVSEKNFDEGHILRLNFVRKLDNLSKEGKLPFELHIYGTKKNFHNYKGTLPPSKKDDGIFPYKYHFNAENNSIYNYVTEKFTDAILGECFLFYWGCPNIEDYYQTSEKNYYCRLSLKESDFENDLNKIIEAMNKDEWKNQLDKIRSTKLSVLNNFNLFRRLKTVIELSRLFVFCLVDDIQQQNINMYVQQLQQQGFKTCLFLNKKQVGESLRPLLFEIMKYNKNFIFLHHVSFIDKLHQNMSIKMMKHPDLNAKFVGLSQDTINVNNLQNSSFYVKLDFCEILAKQILTK